MILELPDTLGEDRFSAQELRLELACALFARRKISAIAGAHLAGIDLFSFQQALRERSIEIVTEQHLLDDAAAVKKLFPS